MNLLEISSCLELIKSEMTKLEKNWVCVKPTEIIEITDRVLQLYTTDQEKATRFLKRTIREISDDC